MKTLCCAVCGLYTSGRQWYNRDNGYGLCESCLRWLRERGESEEEIKSCYGVEGVHFNCKTKKMRKQNGF